jgi:hypothetical protein
MIAQITGGKVLAAGDHRSDNGSDRRHVRCSEALGHTVSRHNQGSMLSWHRPASRATVRLRARMTFQERRRVVGEWLYEGGWGRRLLHPARRLLFAVCWSDAA